MSMIDIEHAQNESLRSRNKREKLARIEVAARALFAEKGFPGTSTRELARRARIGAGTLFTYFAEKRDLLLHMFRKDIAETTDQAFRTVPRDVPFIDQVGHVFGALFDYYQQDIALSRVFVKELMFLDERRRGEMVDLTLGFMQRLAELVAQGQERGEVREDLFALQAASQLFGVYYLAVVMWLGGALPNRAALDAQFRPSLVLAMEGLSRRGGE